MSPLQTLTWTRSGITLLWNDPQGLRRLTAAADTEAVSLQAFLRMAKAGWPDNLPSNQGDALVVAGLDAAMELLDTADTHRFLEDEVATAIRSFQRHFEESAALVFWLPDGHKRIKQDQVTHAWSWRTATRQEPIALGRALCGGAETDLQAVLPSEPGDSAEPIGLFIKRIS